ncbi:MAG: PGPGW domain-containing protein [Sneathiella sp.]
MKKFKTKIKVPQSRFRRLLLGWGLVLGGILGFLPVVGFWMLPLGIIVLSVDLPFARRLRRRTEVWWGRRKKK